MSTSNNLYVKDIVRTHTLASTISITGNLSSSSNTIVSTNTNGDINLIPDGFGEVVGKADPVKDLAFATKQYVDNALSGLTFKAAVRVATESALDTYTQSGVGVGATLTAVANGSINNSGIDGVTNLVLGDRILVKTEGSTSDQHNGVYSLTQVGDAGRGWVMTRATDFDEDIEVVGGAYVLLSSGIVNSDVSYVISTSDPIIVDVTAIEFARFAPTTGENNTSSNVGIAGVGVFKQKNVENFEFKKIVSTSAHITISDNTGDSTVDFSFVSGEIISVGALDAGSISSNFGNIDIGTSTLDAGNATLTQLDVDSIRINTNTISSVNSNGDINILPNGTGETLIKADPVSNLGIATKQYVDNASSGLDTKDPARVTTAAALDAYTQSGTGVGAMLTAVANGSINNSGIDGVTDLVVTDRVLVRGPGATSDVHNGMYEVTQVGDGSSGWVLTRTADFDGVGEVKQGTYSLITEGTVYQGSSWTVATSGVITVDTTAITFTQFTIPSASVIASNEGNGGVGVFKQKTGNTLEFRNVNSTNNMLTVALDNVNNEIDLTVNSGNITTTGELNSGSIASGFGPINNGASAITTTGAATFGSVDVDNITLDGSSLTYNGTANSIDIPFNLANALSVKDVNANTYMQFVSSTGAFEVKLLQNASVTGTIVTTSTVNGRDMPLDGTQHDAVWATGISDMTAAEVNQLENIGATTISPTQWGYLGATDQAVASSDLVAFQQLTVDDIKLDDGTITFSGATTMNMLLVPDNMENALNILDTGGRNFIKIKSLDTDPRVKLLQVVEFKKNMIIQDTSEPDNPLDGEGRLYKKNGDDGLYWKPDTAGVAVDLTTAVQYKRAVVTDTESPYTILATDEIIGVDSSGGAVELTLPLISGIGGSNNYRLYNIVDESGTSALNNIIVKTGGSDTINKNSDDMLIDIDHTSITLYNDGISNWIIR